MSNLVATFETITPEKAAETLSRNKVNRPLLPQRVKLYALQMATGKWHETGEAIQLSAEGVLLNGQHRLSACIKAGASFTTLVVRGVQPYSMAVMDSGRPRSLADALRFQDLPNGHSLAATVRTILSWRNGWIRDNSAIASNLTRDMMVEFAMENSAALSRSVNRGRQIRQTIGMSTSTWAALHYMTSEMNEEVADLFSSMVIDGLSQELGSPVAALRSWAIQSVINKQRREPYQQLGVGIKAWNAFVTGKKMHLLKMMAIEDLPSILAP